jgi:hypothetical protein
LEFIWLFSDCRSPSCDFQSTPGYAVPRDNNIVGDVVIVERHRAVQVVASIPARYSLDRPDVQDDKRVYSGRAVLLSPHAIALAAPVIGAPGDRVTVTIEHIGRLTGAITKELVGGFVMSVMASEEGRARLAAQIEWFELYKNHDVGDRRRDNRVVPRNPLSALTQSDGTTLRCFVIDFSATGAAISAQQTPEIGAVVAIGNLGGRVVRHFAGGFAVEFITPQDKDNVERLVSGYRTAKR